MNRFARQNANFSCPLEASNWKNGKPAEFPAAYKAPENCLSKGKIVHLRRQLSCKAWLHPQNAILINQLRPAPFDPSLFPVAPPLRGGADKMATTEQENKPRELFSARCVHRSTHIHCSPSNTAAMPQSFKKFEDIFRRA
ncbi:MAG TPA: hypothetical protein VFF11_07550 [Candidatus Binatia bacterium]|nr:hypothetical protein [Candidatus Binatia bacterium]